MNDINTSKLKAVSSENILVYLAFLSVFLHYAVTAIAIAALGLFVLIKSETRKYVFAKKSHLLLSVFCLITIVTALFYKNYLGVICSIAFYLLILIFYFVKSIITEHMLERSLSLCCKVVIPLSLAVAVEKCLHISNDNYRCKLWFFNANYMAALFASIALFCVYKIINNSEQIWLYFVSFAASVIAMYLSGSMFSFIELLVGVCLLLILRKKYIILAAFLFITFLGLVVLYFCPEIFPRILKASQQTGKRIDIWYTSMELIKQRPLFGQGFLTYFHNANQNPDIYQTTHSHNFALEPLLCFGIVGTIFIILMLWLYLKKLIKCKEFFNNDKVTSLVLSLCCAVLIHSTTDLTLMWLQTGLLYVLIMASVGIDERKLEKGGRQSSADD